MDDARPELRYPDFVCIGAQKAGTTWLDSNLRSHPGLWLPPVKELHYFSELYLPAVRAWIARYRHQKGAGVFKRTIRNVPKAEWNYRELARIADIVAGPVSDDWYGRIFALAGPDQVCGEVTPDYGLLPDAGVEHALRLSPDLRVVLSLRDPIERAWSHIRMNARARGEAGAAAIPLFAQNREVHVRTDYPKMIARWRKHIAEDRFLVLFMDDIAVRPHAVLETLCAFLGVPFRKELFAAAGEVVLPGEAQAIPDAVLETLKVRLAPVYEGVAALYPEIGARWAAKYY